MRGLGLVLVAALLLPTEASAYAFTYGYGWNTTMDWEMHNSGSTGSLSNATLEDILEDSIEAWSAPTCSDFKSRYDGTTSANSQSHGDGNNVVNFLSSWPSSYGSSNGTIGITMSMASGSALTEFDMNFNEQKYTFVDGQPGGGSQVDLQSVATHEFGHAVGLDHSNQSSATMYASYDNGTGQRTLASDDENGVCALYPSGKTGGGGDTDNPDDGCAICDTCTEAEDCPPDDLCVDFGIGHSICTQWCDDGDCPGDSVCYVVSGSGGVDYNLCLNPDANDEGVCPNDYECVDDGSSCDTDDGSNGGGGSGTDEESTDTGDDTGASPGGYLPSDENDGICGCAAAVSAPYALSLLFAFGGLVTRRRR
jgi:hypothetical protein